MNKRGGSAVTVWAAAMASSIALAFGTDPGTVHAIAEGAAGGFIAAPFIYAGGWGIKNIWEGEP